MQGQRKIDNWGGGAHVHIFVFIDFKNNGFQRKINDAQHEYMNMCPPLTDLPRHLGKCEFQASKLRIVLLIAFKLIFFAFLQFFVEKSL